MQDESRPDPLRSPALDGLAGLRHGFFTRVGGVSEGIYRGLNIGLGSSDEPALVRENRARVAEAMGVEPERFLTPYQFHSADVFTVREPFGAERPKADAVVTDRPGLALGISTADCGPVLFADPDARVIGAAHAGWKGALGGVLENTVAAMEALGASRSRIRAVLGPSISQANYEVGPEFVERLGETNARYLASSPKPGHALFDLNAYTLDRLRELGLERVEGLGRCTYREEDLFFSFRRTTHRGEPDYGRQVSVIVLEDI
ncbi:MAG: peptidoglycan editing factor PgeF [Mesorhizobium amorphae]|nr:MAG: peptidoglycan editing factor PgeF [Mesorhizobium amorphae]